MLVVTAKMKVEMAIVTREKNVECRYEVVERIFHLGVKKKYSIEYNT
jgi:hypothetical protein